MPESEGGTVIELHYTLCCDDIVAFNLHHVTTSPTARQTRRRVLFWSMFSLSAYALVDLWGELVKGYNLVQALTGIYPLLILMLLFLLIYPKLYHWSIRRYARRSWNEGKNKTMIGELTLRVDKDGIQYTGPHSASRFDWEVVERVDALKNYIFLYISASNAIALPRCAFTSGRQMIELLQLVGRCANVPVPCPICHYNLMGTQQGRCPECGYPGEM